MITEFKTKNGRSVFDGSGIFPDIYTDPDYYSPLAISLFSNYLIFDYANKFSREHSTIAAAKDFTLTPSEYQEFVTFLNGKKYDYTDKTERKIEELKKTAIKDDHYEVMKGEFTALENKMKDYKSKDLLNHDDEIKQILESEIAARYYFQKGRLESSFKNDQEVKKAIEVFNNTNLYSSILRGDGIYKVIGKPGSEVQAKANSERELDEEEKN